MEKNKVFFKDIENMDELVDKTYLSDDLKEQIFSADVIILPIKEFRDIKTPLFPRGTESIYLYLKKNLPSEINLEIAISDENFKELSLNHALIDLGIFMLKEAILPFFLNILANYAFYKFPLIKNKVKLKIILSDKLKLIDFEGSADDFKVITKELKKILKNE